MTAHRVTTNPLSDALAAVCDAATEFGMVSAKHAMGYATDAELDAAITAYTEALAAYYAVVHNSGADMAALAVA